MLRFCLLCLFNFSLVSACYAEPVVHTNEITIEDPWQSPDFIQQAFEAVALHDEFSAGERPIRKWQSPLKVWIEDKTDNPAQHRYLTETHLNHLSKLTTHPIQWADTATQANVTVLFTEQKKWVEDVRSMLGERATQHLRHAVCMASFKLNQHGAIQRAWVIIPADQAQMHRKLVSCVVEELTQIMGLPNDSERVYPSIFNDKTPEALLTGLDALLLQLLYHPQVKIGMRRQQVMPLVNAIIAEWQKNGVIAQAEKNVRTSELYNLLGY